MLVENKVLAEFAELIREKKTQPYSGELKTGVDLGTANIVIAVTDSENRPVAGASAPSHVVKDGIVVDFIGAIRTVKELKAQLVTSVVDEPTAAAAVLGITDGAVVDVGGGTTGISILKDGKVIFTADEATGGTHMTLVLAGYYGISLEEAEELKKDPSREDDVFPIIKPVVSKMASIVKRFLQGYDVDKVYVVGGACCFKEFENVFEKELGIPAIKTNDTLLVTPLGIAWSSR